MLWVDKHRPLTLEKMDYLKDQATQLGRLASSGDLPHLLFYGPSGAGKKTRVMALLRAMFGSGVEKVGGVSRACWEEGEGMGAWQGRSTWGWSGKPPLHVASLRHAHMDKTSNRPHITMTSTPTLCSFFSPGENGAQKLFHALWQEHRRDHGGLKLPH
jgi:hypothetical protein